MGRKLRSPTRTISNRGELPRFIGQFPCAKGTIFPLTFDSISALLCGVYLEWRPAARVKVVVASFMLPTVEYRAQPNTPL